MKNIILLLSFAAFGLTNLAQTVNVHAFELTGNVKSVKNIVNTVEKSDWMYSDLEYIYGEWTYFSLDDLCYFDTLGKLEKVERTDRKWIYQYEGHLLLKEILLSDTDSLLKETNYIYGNDNLLVKCYSDNFEANYEYNEDGKLTKENRLLRLRENPLKFYIIYSYRPDGTLEFERHYDEKGFNDNVWYWEKHYSENGFLIYFKNKDQFDDFKLVYNGKVYPSFIFLRDERKPLVLNYQFDEQGNWIKLTTSFKRKNLFTVERIITYHK